MRSLPFIIATTSLILFFAGCTPADVVLINTADRDGDGLTVLQGDCNDYDACIFPIDLDQVDPEFSECANLHENTCDGVDDNCNGELDEAAVITTYRDSDEDGYGDIRSENTLPSCDALQNGYVTDKNDCNDNDKTIHPNADEVCDAAQVDENCNNNSNTDPLAAGLIKFFPDRDNDGYGDETADPVFACSDPTNYNADYVIVYLEEIYAKDCNDNNEFINPDATEMCNYTDDDCNEVIDDDFDVDLGGEYCTPQEVCDGFDNNGNGKTDEGYDVDSDGYTSELKCDCLLGSGVTCGSDCDDNKASVNPAAIEQCDEADNDCDGNVDEAERDGVNEAYLNRFYVDSDGDGFGKFGSEAIIQCYIEPGQSTFSTDCDDLDDRIFPGSPEGCDGKDNNCNGVVDEDVPYLSYYRDADSDGVGMDPAYPAVASTEYTVPVGAPAFLSTCRSTAELEQQYGVAYVLQSDVLDCNDYEPLVNPKIQEQCNFIDDDCSKKADEVTSIKGSNFENQLIEYVIDDDNDSYPSKLAQSIPAEYTDDDDTESGHVFRCRVAAGSSFLDRFVEWRGFDSSDCLDSLEDDPSVIEGVRPEEVKPGGQEQCNGYDDNCNGTIDDRANFRFWYLDADRDTFGALTDNAPFNCKNPYETSNVYELYDCNESVEVVELGSLVDGVCTPIDVSTWFDCDDTSSSVHSYQKEVCSNSIDDNCDGYIDRLAPGKSAEDPNYGVLNNTIWYKDDDSDGFGRNDTSSVPGCSNMPYATGYVQKSTVYTNNSGFDCKDTDPLFNPAAYETCDDQADPANRNDEDCDGSADEDSAVDAYVWYRDSDADGYGNSAVTTRSCYKPSGYVADFTDCQDNEARRNPGAAETCDGLDNNCNGAIDEGGAGGASTWYRDADSDTFGNSAVSVAACVQPSGYVSNSSDCNDSNASVKPSGTEICDPANADEDCDGTADDSDSSFDRNTAVTYYIDSDSDGFGKLTATGLKRCDPPSDGNSYAPEDHTDCDDTDPTINPQARESAGDGVDQNCDLSEICYLDNDNDGYRPDASSTVTSTDKDCSDSREAGDSIPVGDCNDSNASIKPRATETAADGVDSDCDGKELCYKDSDGDGYRPDSTSTVVSGTTNSSGVFTCSASGEASSSTPVGDCRDDVATINPAATETVGNGVDDNCNGTESCYTDADDDGYRPNSTSTVTSPNSSCLDAGEASITDPIGDCNDSNGAIHPAATELTADNVDQNCDSKEVCFADLDNDGYRPSLTATVVSPDSTCSGSSEATSSVPAGDCDDNNSSIHPSATEVVGNEVDEDCSGGETCFADADNDGFRASSNATVSSSDSDCSDSGEAVYSDASGDCDDSKASVKPGATEVAADSVDQNCDGIELCFADYDNDSYRPDSTSTVLSSDTDCSDAREAVSTDLTTDCDDSNSAINPGATEITGDQVDSNCDNQETCYADADNDGLRPSSTSTVSSADTDCADSGEAVSSDLVGDCNDTDPLIYSGATELCDTKDNDCNGLVDDNAGNTYIVDADGDGFGSDSVSAATTKACSLPSGYSTSTTDCDDSDAQVLPGGTDHCGDGKDGDCDSSETCVGSLPADATHVGSVAMTSTVSSGKLGASYAFIEALSDGTQRWAVGAPAGYTDGSGAVYIFEGPATGGSVESSAELVLALNGEAAGDAFGFSMSAGDFDGDGAIDLAIGAPDEGGAGSVYVVGNIEQLVTTTTPGTSVAASDVAPFVKISGVAESGMNSPFTQFGFSVAMNGSFFGSPDSDLIVGDPRCDGIVTREAGGCVMAFDGASVSTCSATGACPATCVAKVVGSGVGDFALTDAECAAIGSSNPVSNSFSASPWIGSGATVTDFGVALAYLPNLQSGQGGPPDKVGQELAVGVPGANSIVVYSAVGGGTLDDDVTIAGPLTAVGFGRSLYATSQSLVNRGTSTGVIDLMVGAAAGPTSAGSAFLLAGEQLLTHDGTTVDAFVLDFAETGSVLLGRSMITTEVDSDTHLDIVIAAPGTAVAGSEPATVYVYFGPFTGGSSTIVAEQTWDMKLTLASGSGFGAALGLAGDSTGSQLVVGAPFANSISGAVYTFDLAIPTN